MSEPQAPRPSDLRPNRVGLIPWLIALGAVVAAATFGFALNRQGAPLAAVEETARSFTEALLTYDSDELAEARTRIRPLVSERFFANYDTTLSALAAVNSSAEGSATEVFVRLTASEAASAVVVTDSTAETASGRARTSGSYLRLDLIRAGGQWRVDRVVELFAGSHDEDPDS